MEREKYDRLEQVWEVFDDPCWDDLGDIINVPKVVVCGNQSSGKSSVLREIAGLDFPIRDDLCTRFVARVAIRQNAESSCTVRIIPDLRRDVEEQARLKKYVSPVDDPTQLGRIITEAGRVLGVEQNQSFKRDTLEVKIADPNMRSITLLDLPGLIQIPGMGQDEKDVEYVKSLVEEHVRNPCCIVLAIIDASIQVSGHSIFEYIKKHDPEGARAMAILTKPDNPGGPNILRAYVNLVSNQVERYKLKLGWHILRNRAWNEMEISQETRNHLEDTLLSGEPFGSVADSDKGAAALKIKIVTILHDFFTAQLPGIKEQVSEKKANLTAELERLPTWPLSHDHALEILRTYTSAVRTRLEESIRDELETDEEGVIKLWTHPTSALKQKLLNQTRNLKHTLREIAPIYDLRGLCASASSYDIQAFPEPNNHAQNFLKHAKKLLQEHPVHFGGTPSKAVTELFLKQTRDVIDVLRRHTERVVEIVEADLKVWVKDIVPAHYQGAITDSVIMPALLEYKERLRSLIPEWLVSPGYDPSQFLPAGPLLMTHIGAVRRKQWEHGISHALMTHFHPDTEIQGILPKVEFKGDHSLDLQVLKRALVAGVNEKDLLAAEVVATVRESYDVSACMSTYSRITLISNSCWSGNSRPSSPSAGVSMNSTTSQRGFQMRKFRA